MFDKNRINKKFQIQINCINFPDDNQKIMVNHHY